MSDWQRSLSPIGCDTGEPVDVHVHLICSEWLQADLQCPIYGTTDTEIWKALSVINARPVRTIGCASL